MKSFIFFLMQLKSLTLKHLRGCLLSVGLLFVAPFLTPSWAQLSNITGTKSGVASNTVKTEQVTAVLRLYAPSGLKAGTNTSQQWLVLEMKHAPEWHTYWKNPGDAGLATQLSWTTPPGLSMGATLWPRPERIALGDLINFGYQNQTALLAPLVLDKPLKDFSNPLVVKLHANWLVCRQECIPQEGDFQIVLSDNNTDIAGNLLAQRVLDEQPKLLPSARATANANSLSPALLSLQIQGLPDALEGHQFDLFPEQAELLKTLPLQTIKGAQRWSHAAWLIDWPVSELRAESPKQWSLMMVDLNASPDAPKNYKLVVDVQTPWPTAMTAAPNPDTAQAFGNGAPVDALNSPSSLSFLALLIALLSAFLGGLVLNLMPCVLPVLAIKALSFLPKEHDAHPKQRFLAEFYALGIWVTLLTLGGLILLLRAGGAQLGWGFQLQSPEFVVFLCVLFTLIALNLWGIFEIRQAIPTFLSSVGSKHQWLESFLSGALSVLIATPCTAPFMGASIGLAFSIPTWQGMLLFSMLGLGLSFPILLIGWFPKAVNFIPKPGAWMVTFRACLGFPMALTVLWLSWVLAQQAGITAMVVELMLLINLSACAWAFSLKNKAVGPSVWSTRVAWALLIVFIGFQGLWVLWVKSSSDLASIAPSGERFMSQGDIKSGPVGSASQLKWHAWSKEAVSAELAQGHLVFVDYTAAWCLSCQFNKLTFQKDRVQAAFKSHNVTLFQADWTRQDPAITQSLNDLGRNGVPVYILLKDGQSPHFLSEFVTEQEILTALDAL